MEKINDRGAWTYRLTWHTNKHTQLLVGEVKKQVVELLAKLCVEMAMSLDVVEITSDSVSVIISLKNQVNITKILKVIQKKLSKSLYKKLPELKEVGVDLWDKFYLISSTSSDVSEVDIRIEKILDALWAVEYYDLDEGVTDDLEEFKNYLVNRQLGIIDYGDSMFLVDQEAIEKEINLNCFECTKVYKYGCCCGSPCGFSSKNMKIFDDHLLHIEDEIKNINEDSYKEMVANGGLVAANGTIKEYNGHCSLLVEHEGSYKCVTHKYALDHQMPPYDLCPLSCLMYPLEMIELITDKQKKVILLTSVLDEHFAKEYGRWGSYKSLDVDLRCIDKTAHNEVFKEKDYNPVYKVNKNLLIHELGAEVYKGIEDLFK